MSSKKSTNLNSVPKIIFLPFKSSRLIIAALTVINFILIALCALSYNFTSSDLSYLAELTVNLIFVIGAIGLTIFSLKIDNGSGPTQNKETKKELILRYIGMIFLDSSIAITSYILSLLDFSPLINKAWSILVLIVLLQSIASTLATIVAYFNIRD
jgi:hypothetical protein